MWELLPYSLTQSLTHILKNAALTFDLGLSASAASSCCIFTLAVRQPPVLASCIEIYYLLTTHECEQEGTYFALASAQRKRSAECVYLQP